MPTLTTRPPDDPAGPNDPTANGRTPEETLRARILAGLGYPPDLYKLSVFRLWPNHYRVNVLTGRDPAVVQVAHSFFVQTTDAGEIDQTTPSLRRVYPKSVP